MRKAQAIAADIFITLSILILILIILVYLWNDYNNRLVEDVEYERMQIIAQQITSQLIKTKGVPSAWETDLSNFEELGLATRDMELSTDKVDEFFNLPYSDVRQYFHLDIAGYECNFNITTLSNKILKSSGGSFQGHEAVGIERYVLYDDEKAIFKFQIWKK